MDDLLVKLFGWLVKPLPDENRQAHGWRVAMVVLVMANSTIFAGAVALALGAVPIVTHGFAKSTTLDGARSDFTTAQNLLQAQWKEVRRSQVDSKIMDTRVRQCGAIKARLRGSVEADMAVQFATQRLQEELQDYFDLTHERYRLPDCSEV